MRLYSFPSLFSMATNKDVLVADVWEKGAWSPSFTYLLMIGRWMSPKPFIGCPGKENSSKPRTFDVPKRV